MTTEKQPYIWKSFSEQSPDFDRTILVKFPGRNIPFYAVLSSYYQGIVPHKSLPGEVWYICSSSNNLVLWTYADDPEIPQDAINALNLRPV